ncbi:MAG: hypothetical protein V4709_10945 [Pseudomonadota bacterium]
MASSNVSEYLETLLGDTQKFAGTELKAFIIEAKSDNRLFIRDIGDWTEELLKQRALGKIDDDEFRELMEDTLDLTKLQFHKLSSDAKVRAQRIVNGIADLVLKRLLALI